MTLDSRSQTSSSTLDVAATLRRVRRRGRPRPDRTLSGSTVRSTAAKTRYSAIASAGGAIAAPRRARYTDAMWLGFGFFSLLPILFIFLVLHMVRIALRGTRGQRRPEAVWGRDYREQTAAREQPRRGRLENRVFRLAYRLGGRLTVSDLVVDLDFSIGEAESFLNQLVDSTRVTMEVRDDGLVYYEFPEIIARRHRGDGDLPSQV